MSKSAKLLGLSEEDPDTMKDESKEELERQSYRSRKGFLKKQGSSLVPSTHKILSLSFIKPTNREA